MMKKAGTKMPVLLWIMIILIVFTAGGGTVSAKKNRVTVTVNGSILKLNHKPKVKDRKVMLPAAEIFEKLGAKTEYVKENKLLIVTKDELLITMKAKSKTLTVGNLIKQKNKTYTLKQAPRLIKGTIYISTETIEMALGADVKWDAGKKRVEIRIDGTVPE